MANYKNTYNRSNRRTQDDEPANDQRLKDVILKSVRIANIGIPQSDKIDLDDVEGFIQTANSKTILKLLQARLTLKLRNDVEYDMASLKVASGIAKDLQAIEKELYPERYSQQSLSAGSGSVAIDELEQLVPLDEDEDLEDEA